MQTQESSNHPSGTAKERLPSIARRIIQAGPRKHRMQAAKHASITIYERARCKMCASTQSPRPSPPVMPPARRGNPRRGARRDRGGDGVGRSIVIIASALLRGAVLASHRRRIAARGRQGRAHDVADVTQRLAQLLDQVRILAALLLVVDALLCQLRLNQSSS